MALSDIEYQQDILAEIGDDGTVAPAIETIWAKYTAKGFLSKQLQALYTKVDAINRLLGSPAARKRYTFKSKDAVHNLKELTDNLREMRKEALEERNLLEKRLNTGGAPAVGVMAATASITSPAGLPDANSGYYRGNPQTFGPPLSKG
jgi:hypothetical protein